MQFLEGKQHPFTQDTLEKYQNLSALYANMTHDRNEELFWLVNQISDPLVKGQLKTMLMAGADVIHNTYSMHIANRVGTLPNGSKVTQQDYEAWQKEIQPRVKQLWDDLKRNLKPMLFQWYRDY